MQGTLPDVHGTTAEHRGQLGKTAGLPQGTRGRDDDRVYHFTRGVR